MVQLLVIYGNGTGSFNCFDGSVPFIEVEGVLSVDSRVDFFVGLASDVEGVLFTGFEGKFVFGSALDVGGVCCLDICM